MIRKIVVASVLGFLVSASGAAAQERRWQEIGIQGTGFFTKDSSGNGINQHATDTGGFLLSYRYHFNRWLAADASYGTPGTRNRISPPLVPSVSKQMCTRPPVLWWLQRHAAFSGSIPSSSRVRVPLSSTPQAMREDLFLERKANPEQRSCMEAVPTTNSVSTSRFAPNTAASCTNGPTLIWAHCTLARPRTRRNRPRELSSGSSDSSQGRPCPVNSQLACKEF